MNETLIPLGQFLLAALAFGGGLLFCAWLVLDEVKQGFENDAKPYDWENEEW